MEYLSLGQPFDSLSGGELQRLKLVVELREPKPIYVLDEPTTGLHSKDIQMMCQADRIIDLGSGAGDEGGQLLFQGTPKDFFKCQKPVPAKYLQNFVKMNERLLRN
ncbi:hypothetical protein LIZ87_08595 [Lacrimispora sp. 210928-DFI.3.58]|nr:hypothetical protein [Lacrimispora sp. 210928-DFI.3.58]